MVYLLCISASPDRIQGNGLAARSLEFRGEFLVVEVVNTLIAAVSLRNEIFAVSLRFERPAHQRVAHAVSLCGERASGLVHFHRELALGYPACTVEHVRIASVRIEGDGIGIGEDRGTEHRVTRKRNLVVCQGSEVVAAGIDRVEVAVLDKRVTLAHFERHVERNIAVTLRERNRIAIEANFDQAISIGICLRKHHRTRSRRDLRYGHVILGQASAPFRVNHPDTVFAFDKEIAAKRLEDSGIGIFGQSPAQKAGIRAVEIHREVAHVFASEFALVIAGAPRIAVVHSRIPCIQQVRNAVFVHDNTRSLHGHVFSNIDNTVLVRSTGEYIQHVVEFDTAERIVGVAKIRGELGDKLKAARDCRNSKDRAHIKVTFALAEHKRALSRIGQRHRQQLLVATRIPHGIERCGLCAGDAVVGFDKCRIQLLVTNSRIVGEGKAIEACIAAEGVRRERLRGSIVGHVQLETRDRLTHIEQVGIARIHIDCKFVSHRRNGSVQGKVARNYKPVV